MFQPDDIVAWVNQRPLLVSAIFVALISVVILVVLYTRRRQHGAMQPTLDDLAYVRRGYESTEYGRGGHGVAHHAGAQPHPPQRGVSPNGQAPSPPPAATLGWLILQDRPTRPIAIASSPVRIGRADTNDLVLSHMTVHRNHAMLTMCDNNRFELIDQGGTNGSLVNGVPYARKVLNDGDVIELGDVKIVYRDSTPRIN